MADKKPIIIVDLEGTLSNCDHRIHHYHNKDYEEWNKGFIFDQPNNDVCVMVKSFAKICDIMILSAKPNGYLNDVINWLDREGFNIPVENILLRPAGDYRDSVELKEAWLLEILQHFTVAIAFDDRKDICDMYDKYGIRYHLADQNSDKAKCEPVPAPKTTSEFLRESADIFEERSIAYGDSYKSFGKLVESLFPDGVHLESVEDMNRWGVFQMMLSKIHRYSSNFKTGGHKDSLIDLSTYSAMLNELDSEL